MRIISYLVLGLLIITCFFIILSIVFAGSINPINLFSSKNFTYSFSGSPVYTRLYSPRMDIFFNGINNTRGSIWINGISMVHVIPCDEVVLTPYGGNPYMYKGEMIVLTAPESNTDVFIDICKVDDYYYNMNLRVTNNTRWYSSDGYNTNVLSFKKKSDKYIIHSKFAPGPTKDFTTLITRDNGSMRYEFPTRLYLSACTILYPYNGSSAMIKNFQGTIDYKGEISIITNDSLKLYIPVESVDNTPANSIWVEKTDGSLVVRNRDYHCSGADDLKVTNYGEKMYFDLLGGKFHAYGKAVTLRFRDQEFSYPISVFLNEGHFTIFTGILTALLTLVLRQMVSEYKKK